MTVFHRMAACLLLATSLSGCIRTYSAVVPSGAGAYGVIPPPRANAALPTTYPLEPGDKLRIEVFQEPDMGVDQTEIDPAGNVSLPLLGTVRAAGLTTGQLSLAVQAALAKRYLRDPQVSIALIEAVQRVVAVEGEVKQPGVYAINGQTTLLTALALARSPTPTAKLNEVMVFRVVDGQRIGGRFDIAMIRAGRAQDPQILPDDVIVVGYSRLQGTYRDLLQAAPLFNIFTRY